MSRKPALLDLPPEVGRVPQPPGPPPSVRSIPDDALHQLAEWQRILNRPTNTLKREVRLGRLRASKRAGKVWTTGLWIRQWLEAGEVRRRPAGDGGR